MVNQRPSIFRAVMGMHRKSRALIHQQNVVIFVDNVQLGRCHCQVGIFFPGFVKKFIVDIQLKHIPSLKPGIPLHTFSAQFDSFQTDIFLSQGGRQQRNSFGEKTVQPLSRVVGANCQFFHGFLPVCSSKCRFI